jgi:hypothetical protein
MIVAEALRSIVGVLKMDGGSLASIFFEGSFEHVLNF